MSSAVIHARGTAVVSADVLHIDFQLCLSTVFECIQPLCSGVCFTVCFYLQLCEGHRNDWQNMLRDQPGSIADIDVVSAVAAYTHQLCRKSGPIWNVIVYWDAWYSVEVIQLAMTTLNQLFQTLTEFTQGPCVGNQTVLSSGGLFEAIAGVWDALLKAMQHHPAGPAAEGGAAFGRWESLKELKLIDVPVRS